MKRSLAEDLALDERLRAAWGPAVEVPSPDTDENGYRQHTPWRVRICPDCRALVPEQHLVLHHDFHQALRGWLAE